MLRHFLPEFLRHTVTETSPYQYTFEAEPARAGQSAVHRHFLNSDALKHYFEEDCQTMQKVILRAREKFGKKNCVWNRDPPAGDKLGAYQVQSYNEVIEKAHNLGAGLIHNNMAPEIADFQDYSLRLVAVFSPNSARWFTFEFACMLHRMVCVPMYDTLGPDSIYQILHETEISTMLLVEKHV